MGKRACILRQYYYDLQLRRESEALNEAGFEVDVICLQEGGHKSFEIDNGVRIYRVPLNRKRGNFIRYLWDYFSFFFIAGAKVTWLHLKRRYSFVQATSMPDFLVFATLGPRCLGAKTVAFLKEPTPELGETLYGSKMMHRFLRLAEKWAIKYAHVVFTVTQQLKDVYVSRGAKADKIHVVLNAPDSRHILGLADPSIKPDPDFFTLIYHGSIEERYGHDIVLQAVDIARKVVPNLRLHITGTGEYLPAMLEMIADLHLEENVKYLGFLSMEELAVELARADAGIVAQKSSPYSNLVHTTKMYEYMMFGKPAIVSRLRSVADYFDESALCFFESDNPQSMAESIIDLCQHPEKRESLVTNARRLYAIHCWDNQKKTYLNVLENLIRR